MWLRREHRRDLQGRETMRLHRHALDRALSAEDVYDELRGDAVVALYRMVGELSLDDGASLSEASTQALRAVKVAARLGRAFAEGGCGAAWRDRADREAG